MSATLVFLGSPTKIGALTALEGDADGTDAYTFAVNKHQLELTLYMNVPHMLARNLCILEGAPPRTW
jgi:hypothetical protein